MAQRTPSGEGKESRHQGGPGRTLKPQGGNPKDGLAGVHVRFAQKSRAQVRGRNGRGDEGACLLPKGFSGLLGDLGT
jgi:hypothetical protein